LVDAGFKCKYGFLIIFGNLAIKKLDKNHWIAYPCADSLTLEYEIYAFDLSVRCAYLTNQRAFFEYSQYAW
jgi:predicted metalloprotease with PDZ domain